MKDDLFNLNDGQRELVDQAKAQTLVAAALGDRDPQQITRVCLSNKSYDEEAANVIAEVSAAAGHEERSPVRRHQLTGCRPQSCALDAGTCQLR